MYFGFESGRQAWGDVQSGVTNLQAANGILSGDTTTNNPAVYGPYMAPFFQGSRYTEWELRINVDAGTELQIYWIYSGASWDNTHSLTLPMIADSEWHTYTLDMPQNPQWTDYAPAMMRIDPTHVAGAHFEIDYIRTTDKPLPVETPGLSRLMLVLDNSAFMLVGSFTDAFGNIWSDNQGDEIEPHGFTGQEREADLDLYHYGAPMYMPELGRCLQVDPARQYWNPYSYVGNNPVFFIDPTGNGTWCVGITGKGGILILQGDAEFHREGPEQPLCCRNRFRDAYC